MLAAIAPPETMRVEGTITGLSEQEGDLEGVVRFLARVDGRTRMLQTRFEQSARNTIFRAFQDKVLFSIALTGELNRAAKPWALENPREFSLVKFDPESSES